MSRILVIKKLISRVSETYYFNRNNKAISINFHYLVTGNAKEEKKLLQ